MATDDFKTLMSALLKILAIVSIVFFFVNNANTQTFSSANNNFRKAEELFAKGECKKALAYINTYISRRNEDFDAYLLRGMINECLDNAKEAIVDYSMALQIQSSNSEVLFNRAILRYQVAQYQMAIQDLKKVLSIGDQPTNMVYYKKQPAEDGISGLSTMATMRGEVYNQLGLSFLELEKFEMSKLYFDSAITIQPSSMYYNNRGLAYIDLGDHRSALKDFEQALQLDSLNSSAMFNMLSLLEGRTSSSDKIEKLSMLIDNNKALPEIFVQRGMAYYQDGNYYASIKDYNAAISLEKNNPDHYINRGLAYFKLQNYKRAIDDLTYAIGLQSNYAKPYVNRGNVYFQMKAYKEAINDYDIALLHDPDNASVYYNRAMSWLSLKEMNKACRDLNKASELGMEKADKYLTQKCMGQ